VAGDGVLRQRRKADSYHGVTCPPAYDSRDEAAPVVGNKASEAALREQNAALHAIVAELWEVLTAYWT
jgi:hypothetical protein